MQRSSDYYGRNIAKWLGRGLHIFPRHARIEYFLGRYGTGKVPGDEAVVRGHIVYGKFSTVRMPTDKARTPGNTRRYMVSIVKKGGEPLGRSEDMPDWGGDLSDAQIQDVWII